MDFILCLGDDSLMRPCSQNFVTNENHVPASMCLLHVEFLVYRVLTKIIQSTHNTQTKGTVSKKPSKAEYYVHDVDDAEMLINTLELIRVRKEGLEIDGRSETRLGKSPVRPVRCCFVSKSSRHISW